MILNIVINKNIGMYKLLFSLGSTFIENSVDAPITIINSRINAIDMNKENLDGDEIKNFAYLEEADINYQN